MQIIVDGLAISYFETGEGPANLLLLHGWADSAGTFDSLVKQLGKDYRVITLDLPGFGASQIPDQAWTLDDYARFVSVFVNKLGLSLEGVVGHSNGGAIAIHGISHEYFSTNKLVLLASSGIRSTNMIRKQTLKALAKPAKIAVRIAPQRVQRRIKKKIYEFIGSDFMTAEHLRETFKNIVSADVVRDARKLSVPTLLIYGDEDTATPLAHGQILEGAISGSRLFVIEKAGHFLHQEQVYKVARLIKEFVG